MSKNKERLTEETKLTIEKNFKAMKSYSDHLEKNYGESWYQKEDKKAEVLWREIGKPSFSVTNVESLCLSQLLDRDPILRMFYFYFDTHPEDIALRLKILEHIYSEDNIKHLIHAHYWFGFIQIAVGYLMIERLVAALYNDFFYYRDIDLYFSILVKKQLSDLPTIQELRGQMRGVRQYQDGDCKVHEITQMIMTFFGNNISPAIETIKSIVKKHKKRFEHELIVSNEDIFKYINDDFIDGYLCAGWRFDFPGYSERMFCSDKFWLGDECDLVIIRHEGNEKVFKAHILDKYLGMVVNKLPKINSERTYFEEPSEDQMMPQKFLTPEFQEVIAAVLEVAKTFEEKKTETIAGHLAGGVKNKLSEKYKDVSTTGSFNQRLKQLKYDLEKMGYGPDTHVWKNEIEKFRKTRGRILDEKMEFFAEDFDQKKRDLKGREKKDEGTLETGGGSALEAWRTSQSGEFNEEQEEKLAKLKKLPETYSSLLEKIKKETPLTATERKQLQRLKEKFKDI